MKILIEFNDEKQIKREHRSECLEYARLFIEKANYDLDEFDKSFIKNHGYYSRTFGNIELTVELTDEEVKIYG